MFRQATFDEQLPDRTAEVAAVIAEEGLRYVSDGSPGYRRKRTGTSFSYHDKDGKRISNKDVIRRIKSIGIPPAYEFVWICPSPNGTSRRRASMRAAVSNTAIIRSGANCAIKPNTNISWSLRPPWPSCAAVSQRT